MRRWSMTAMVVVTLANAARADEAAALAALEKLGAGIIRDKTKPEKPVVGVDLSSTTVTDTDLVHLRELKNLQAVSLGYCSDVTDKGVAHLNGLTAIRELYLYGTQ